MTRPVAGPENQTVDRKIVLQYPVNMRDLGGLKTMQGSSIRSGVLFRSDNFDEATPADAALLRQLGVRTVIDLRTAAEAERGCSGAMHAPLEDGFSFSILNRPVMTDEQKAEVEKLEKRGGSLAEMYLHFAQWCALSVRATISAVTDEEGRAAVVHCQIGKDRTGVVVAILLALCGVSDEEIAQDYAQTSHALPELFDKVGLSLDLESRPELAAYMTADPETMLQFLGDFRERYESPEGYAQHIGLGDAEVSALRSVLAG